MKVCIHRGSNQIGGSCVELEHDGARILVDLGQPLDVDYEDAELPAISNIHTVKGVVLSHGHRDHWGLLPKIDKQIPVYLGQKTLSILKAAEPFVPGGYAPPHAITYSHKKTFEIGPFHITPYLMDHSGFDAYSLDIEAGGKRVLYSGDVRGHGRKAKMFESFVNYPPEAIDVMLMEGSSLGRLTASDRFETEAEIEERLREAITRTPGMLLVACSFQNIDRVVSVYRAARRNGRQLLVDAYGAEVLKATKTASIPKPADGWDDVKVFIPQFQRRHLVRSGIAHLVDGYKGRRVFPEELKAVASNSVMIVRPWMITELSQLGALEGSRAIWSQWDGYLQEESGIKFIATCEALNVPMETIHTSGHADIQDLQRYANAVAPKRLVPIHTFFPERFSELFNNVEPASDGDWIEV
ncbi:MBL fold metallo-hydrolase [Brucella sp. NBRC 12950]|uniref:MBL fold metallo-hydrolase n=1 Tax=Brucella sp. NBRC 12950 TaxID=2994518 RepID=UPI0024A2CB03|nr:MBL fold metallo-hydrolase [Brucella sp. NBRC 12950]GLU28006.1 MBL fold hydrolase [Brucella sp. NBRC 12950]